MQLFKSNQSVHEVISIISEVKKISDVIREESYSWNIGSQHGPKIATLQRFIKQLEQRVLEAEESLKYKKK